MTESQWIAKFEELAKTTSNKAEALERVYNYISENYSFSTQSDEAFVYFGDMGNYGDFEILRINGKEEATQVFEVVDGIVNENPDVYQYISSSEAGALFKPKTDFDNAFHRYFGNFIEAEIDSTIEYSEYDGLFHSGHILFDDNSIGTAANDFLSKNYIESLKCSNVNTLFSGSNVKHAYEGYEYCNAFCRAELEAIFRNDSIKTINNIDKSIFEELFAKAPQGKNYEYVCDAIKHTQVNAYKDLYFTQSERGTVEFVGQNTENARSVVDYLIGGKKLETNSMDKILDDCGKYLSKETKSTLESISKQNDKVIVDIILKDSDELARLSDSNYVGKCLNERLSNMMTRGDSEAAAFIAKNSDEIVKKLGNNSDDFGKALIEHLSTKSEKELAEYMVKYSDDVLKLTQKESINVGKMNISDYTDAVNSSDVFLDDSGKIIGRSYRNTKLEGLVIDDIPDTYEYVTKSKIYSDFSNDDVMRNTFGDVYDEMSAAEKYALKEMDYAMRSMDCMDELEAIGKATAEYMHASGETTLGVIDGDLISLGSKISRQDGYICKKANTWLEIASKSDNYKNLAGGASKIGKAVGFFGDAVYAAVSLKDANEAFIDRRYYETAGIIAGVGADIAISGITGACMAEMLMPYCVGLGAVIGGPVGALLGGLIAGVAGMAIGGLIGYATKEAFIGLGEMYEETYNNAASVRMRVADPLVLDLDGDGFELLSVEDGVYFDADNKDLMEKTQWIAKDDALLALDLNNDGIINDGSELFGTSTAMPDGSLAKSGFEALMQYDLNGDGRIDSEDDIFSDLKVWQDKNSDGISQEDEVKALADMGVSAIELTSDEESGEVRANLVVDSGNDISMGEFGFASQLYNTKEKEEIEISDEIIALPDVQAMGSVKSLHTLMQLDETGVLKGYVAQFARSTDVDEKKELVTKILYFITGADDIVSNSRGGNIDAKQLRVIEQLMGKDFVGTAGPNPVNTAGPILKEMYKDMEDAYYSMLNAQTELKPYMGMMVWKEDENGKRYLDTEIFDKFVDLCTDQGYDMSREVSEVGFYIHSMNKGNEDNFGRYASKYISNRTYFEAIALRSDGSFINGNEGNNNLWGTDSIDIIKGGEGNDTINAGNGVDVLIGGKGDDKLTGGAGSDIYIFNQGDGNDTVDTYAGNNDTWKGEKIKFNDVKAEDVEIQRKNNQLILVNKKTDDRITLNAYYNDSWHGIGTIEFADGIIWDHEYIGQYQMMYEGTDGNDIIYGYDSGFNYNTSEIIDGGAGNDQIRAGAGDDILIGGTGDDYLNGGDGNDTYIFNKGDGKDTVETYTGSNEDWRRDKISFKDVNAGDVYLQRKNNQLLLINKKSGDQITINSYYNDSWHGIGTIEFADGTIWDHEYIGQYQMMYEGTDGNNTIYGYDSGFNYNTSEIIDGGAGNDQIRAGAGDDILIGGTGDDYLNGGEGSDTYIINSGDGLDTIDTYAGNNETWRGDKIKFNDVKAEDVEIQRKNNQLILVNKKTDDRITINAYYNDSWHGIGTIEFADGNIWDHEFIGQYQMTYTGTEKNDTIYGYDTGFNYNTSEVIDGGEGNDTISSGKGDDIIIGGKGNDNLTGGEGSDTYIFNSDDGLDIINTYAGNNETWRGDKIKFNDVKAEDVEIQRKNNQLILVNKKTEDRITINAYYNDSRHGIGIIEFADGNIWDHEFIGQYQMTYTGSEKNDTIYGYDSGFNYNTSEVIDGGEGNDTIRAGKGDDILIGGRGNDNLTGGEGNDTYIFNSEDGLDTVDTYSGTNDTWKGDKIRFNDVKAEDVEIQRKNNQLILVNKKTDDRITINAYYNDSWHGIGIIEFTDGTIWDHEFIGQYQMMYEGTDGNNTIYGYDTGFNYNTSEVIDGGEGNDTIRAGKGDDILIGGRGNDNLTGGEGNDTYIFNSEDGLDTVDTYSGTNDTWKGDKIRFNDVKAEDVEIQRKNNQLILVNKKTDDRITINAYYNDSWHGVGSIEFADGTTWDHDYIGQYQMMYEGTDGNDIIYGYDSGFNYNTSEIIDGGAGNDQIRAGAGDDILIGGTGDDYLNGGEGNDTYIFNSEDGLDTVDTYAGANDTWKGDKIKFNDVRAEDVEIQRKNNQLILVNKKTDDKVTINAYYNDSWHGIGTIEFADGTTWDHDYIGQYQMTYTGTDGNDTLTGFDSGFNYNVSEIFDGGAGDDTIRAGKGDDILTGGSGEDKLYGGAGNDILVGGAGNDYMEGGTGEDIYYIYAGDGNDVIYNYDNTASRADDRLVFGSGIRAGAMSLSRNGNDLLITNADTSQVTTIRSGFSGDYYQLNNLEFDDATATIDYKETRLDIRYRTVTRVDDTIVEDAAIIKDEDIITDTSDVIYERDVIREADTLTVINDADIDILEASGNTGDTIIREDMTDRTGGDILVADILLEEPHDKEISEDNILTDSVETVVNEDVLREDILTVQSTYDDVTVNRTEQDEEKESIFTETLTEERTTEGTTEGTTEVAAEPVRSIDSIVEASINAMHEASDGDVPVQDGNNDTYETADASFASDETSVDQIVEVMVQEMSEPSGSAVSESEVIRTETDSTSTEQLWSE